MNCEKKIALEELKHVRFDSETAKIILKLFPDLEESDYVIKRRLSDLLGYFVSRGADHTVCAIIQKWLEKQEESELSKDLGEYITELSKQFPEVSFAKLSRIAVRIKNWFEKQKEDNPSYPIKLIKLSERELVFELTAFAQHLNKRGAFSDDLQMDFEHEAQTFIELQKHKEL